jgi:hypothetical protein
VRSERIVTAVMAYRECERALHRLVDIHRYLGKHAPTLRLMDVAGNVIDVDLHDVLDAVHDEVHRFDRHLGRDE